MNKEENSINTCLWAFLMETFSQLRCPPLRYV